MGCTTSKQAQLDLTRSPSPLPHNHVVSLTSSTLNSLNLVTEADTLIQIKTSGNQIQIAPSLHKNPKWILRTPTMTPPNEPETINTWEIMAGLDHSLLSRPTTPPPPVERSSFSFQSGAAIDAIEFDQEVLSTFRKAMEELSPVHPSLLRSSPKMGRICNGEVEMIKEIFEVKNDCSDENNDDDDNKVVFYFTSLRGIRKTFEDCCVVRLILRGYGVKVDERDLSMDRGFKDELHQILGEGTRWQLPRVFINGKDFGGVEEVKQMHESGELSRVLEGCEMLVEEEKGPCDECGDVRFVMCETCFGSCKIYHNIDESYHETEGEGEIIGDFMRCPNCNENGIVKCQACC
ncbi:hypothetical protein LUZ60_005778 [Juncus effusus]|nr:hypothetical protein LUZ60_005778 [Juncus effusus]